MRYPLNLASQPFRRDRPIFAASVATAMLLGFLLVALVSLALTERKEMTGTRGRIDQLERQNRTLAAEQARLDAVLRKPENAEVLERSLFLNELLYRKGISWTKIFADLEKIAPYNVRVISIRPRVNARNQISLEMNIGAETTEPVVQFLMKLEASESFGATYVHSSLPPSQTEPLFRYRITVNYAQKV